MRRLTALIGTGLAAAAVASAFAVTSGSAQAPAATTLTFVERSISANEFIADVPPTFKPQRPRPSRGDTFLFDDVVLDAAGTARLGRVRGTCTFLRARPNFVGSTTICDVVYVLGGGSITGTASVTFNAQPITFAITGGTGAYEGARGSGVNTPRQGNDNPLSDTVIRLLP